ncbi:MAG TPA: ferritin-like domain-containing protein [Methylibium sp.]|nr:ferritin-like domain-containing protein [Methylibium sp.]
MCPAAPGLPSQSPAAARPDLRREALAVLALAEPLAKAAAARALLAARDALALDPDALLAPAGPLPGRPARPELLPALRVPQRSIASPGGRAALVHAIAHIEFNAINLALDAVWRFPGLPAAYYRDWLQVAGEEAYHFTLLREHLRGLGHDYGDFPAHDGLWTMTERTAHDPVARMALVPRTLEARGLDATPPLQRKFAKAGDARAVEILEIILRDEIGHVAIGNRWYRWLCERDGLDPVALYPELAARYDAPKPRPPLNLGAREAAGFSAEELAWLNG